VTVRRLVRQVGALFVVLAALDAGIDPARAEEGDRPDARPAVERLTADELAHLRSNLPDWEDLPDERRERIARNVLRLRSLPAADRARLRERMDRFRRQDASLRERMPERLSRLQGPSREKFRVQALVAGAVGRELLRSLPDDARRALEEQRRPVAGPGLGSPGLPPAVLGYAFLRALVEREAETLARSGDALRQEPSAEARPRRDALLARVNAASPEDRPRETRALATFLVEDRLRETVRVAAQGGGDDASAREGAVLGALRAAFPDGWRGTTDDLVERARRGPDDLRRFLARHVPKAERRPNARASAVLLVRFLESAVPWLAANPEARETADRLLESFLGKGFGLPPGALERLPGWDRPAERLRALRRLLLQR
jgi:hypothetical protein